MGNISNALKNQCITYILPLFLENLSQKFKINPSIAFVVLKASTYFDNFYK